MNKFESFDSLKIHFCKVNNSFESVVSSNKGYQDKNEFDLYLHENYDFLNDIINQSSFCNKQIYHTSVIQQNSKNKEFDTIEYKNLIAENIPLILSNSNCSNDDFLHFQKEFYYLSVISEKQYSMLKEHCNKYMYKIKSTLITSLISVFSHYTDKVKVGICISSEEKGNVTWFNNFSSNNESFEKQVRKIDKHIENEYGEHLGQSLSYQILIKFDSFNYEKIGNEIVPHLSIDIKEEKNLIGIMRYFPLVCSSLGVETVWGHLETFLYNAIYSPDKNIMTISILDEKEETFIQNCIGYREKFVLNESLYKLFEKQVKEKPSVLAVVHERGEDNDNYLTYKQLYRAIDILADKINEIVGDTGNTPISIGVYGERSVHTLISILAILKSGNTYVPLDTTYPKSHLEYIVEDATLAVILTTNKYVNSLPENKVKIQTSDFINFEVNNNEEYKEKASDKSDINNTSLIMYTSGSTGKPKGVKHKQHQLINYFNYMWGKYPFNVDDRMCQRTSMNFMPSMWEFMGGLLGGIPTVIISDSIVKDPARFAAALKKNKISYLVIIPSMLQRMFEASFDMSELVNIRLCLTVGEPITLELVQLFYKLLPNAKLIADYGSTEVNGVLQINTDMYREDIECLPGLKPIANVKAYILDENMNLSPVGVTGELYISGACLAEEYVNLDMLTKEKFIDNPFELEGKLYNMGDLASYLPDGTIKVLGRKDSQVKIRGIRIELPSIEKVLLENESIKESVVIVKEIRTGTKRLIAFIIPHDNHVVNSQEIRDFLMEKLPEYMVPSTFIQLNEFPRIPNGKIDHKKLANLEKSYDLEGEKAAINTIKEKPFNVNEEFVKNQLRDTAAAVLKTHKNNVLTSKKYYEIGFDSVTIVDFVNKLNALCNTKLEVVDLYDYSCIDDLTNYLMDKETFRNYINSNWDGVSSIQNNPIQDNNSVSKKQRLEKEPLKELKGNLIKDSSLNVKEMKPYLKEYLKENAAHVLGTDKNNILTDKKYYEIGFDSVTIVDFVNKLNALYSTKLEVTDLYDYSCIDDLTNYLMDKETFRNYINSNWGGVSSIQNNPIQDNNSVLKKQRLEKEPLKELKGNLIKDSSLNVKEMKPYLKEYLKENAAHVLGTDKNNILTDKKYYEIGFDSVTIVDFVNKLNALYSTKLEVADLYDYSCIDDLADFLITEDVFKQYFKKNNHIDEKEKEEKNISNAYGTTNAKEQIENEDSTEKKIAIIGISGRFPGANNVEVFWRNLSCGIDSIVQIPKYRWDKDEIYDSDAKKPFKSVSKWGGFVEGVDLFDSDFFNISPRESEAMDPQQRLCLEESWKALEDAGYSEKELNGNSVGVFIGAKPGDYINLIKERNIAPNPYTTMGCNQAILAARISYHLNLKGPSLTVDTACSSSSVAVHLAYNSILQGECDMAIAGGVSVMSSPELYLESSKMGMFSVDGRCKAFDNAANGIVPGEAVGMVILKRLDKALKDRNQIYGVIAGSGINQDGKTNGITAPSSSSQYELIKSVYEKHKINSEDITYVETHGTGTKLGDPIEIKALSRAFADFTQKKNFCAVGSVKTNIGHTIASSGIVGLIKVLLSMKHKKIPASLHFKKKNEHINFSDSPFFVNTTLKNWEVAPNSPRMAAVSSFGISGTNSHMVIEELLHPIKESSGPKSYYLIPISAKNKNSLRQRVKDLLNWLQHEGSNQSLDDISYTLQQGRSHFKYKLAFVVESQKDLIRKLESVLSQKSHFNIVSNENRAVYETPSSISAKDINKTQEKSLDYLVQLAELYINNHEIDWNLFNEEGKSYLISMPTYPFNRERYWITNENERNEYISPTDFDISSEEKSPTIEEEEFSILFSKDDISIEDHIINNKVILPGAALLEKVLTSVENVYKQTVSSIQSVVWKNTVVFDVERKKINTKLTLGTEQVKFICELEEGIPVCEGILVFQNSRKTDQYHIIDQIKTRCNQYKDGRRFYSSCFNSGLHYGENYQVVKELFYNETELISHMEIPKDIGKNIDNLRMLPQMLDGALHSIAGFDIICDSGDTYLPFSVESIEIVKPLESCCWAYIKLKDKNYAGIVIAEINIFNEKNELLISIKDFAIKPLNEIQYSELKEERFEPKFFINKWIRD
ncbi:amino acid adenylation domain-containing protein [Bacillus wiedmannii]|nr:amino acid adenylation domain-containing protein [Bacillus wiedmannii]